MVCVNLATSFSVCLRVLHLLDVLGAELGHIEDLLRLLQAHPSDAGGGGRLLP